VTAQVDYDPVKLSERASADRSTSEIAKSEKFEAEEVLRQQDLLKIGHSALRRIYGYETEKSARKRAEAALHAQETSQLGWDRVANGM
jgi:hypothetical protein